MKHNCHWPGCPKQVPATMWGCAMHWFKLPEHLRTALNTAYRAGVLSPVYLSAHKTISDWIKNNADNH